MRLHKIIFSVLIICGLGFFLFLSTPLQANTSNISGATVQAERLGLDARTSYSIDRKSPSQNDRLRIRLHVDYGFNDFYAARIVLQQNKNKGANIRHDAIDFVNRFHLLNRADHGYDFGFRISYAYRDTTRKPDRLQFRTIQQIPINLWEVRLNQTIEHETGRQSDSGIAASFGFEVSYPLSDASSLGLQSFNNFGNLRRQSSYSNQSHEVGLILKNDLTDNIDLQIGYLAGISRAATDHSFRLFIGRNF